MDIVLIYLARGVNDQAALRRFLDSYRKMPSGIGHRLIVAMKGYVGLDRRFSEDAALSIEAGAQLLILERDDRFDIGAYQEASGRIAAEYYCFLNSFSHILAPQWLKLLYNAVCAPGVGIAGATGSWQSPPSSEFRRLRSNFGLRHGVRGLIQIAHFPLFPNPHIRTNGFIMSRDQLGSIVFPRRWHKKAMWQFESGRHGLTTQVRNEGLRAVMVTGSGIFDPMQWPQAKGYLSDNQQKLLIADNQTDHYAQANEDERRWLRQTAWGKA